ncbi:DNA-binding response regulator [Terasakiella pusilla]|uniref:DNA-binding response regulator n=1 Tax=Terasakiella pusilla TaxID=64973 RepID=UPI003AA80DB0
MSMKPRILFVDDEPLLLEGIRRSLGPAHQRDWEMVFETDPVAAVELHRLKSFDVVVTDFMMPVLNGIGLAVEMNEIDPGTQIVMLTGAADLTTAADVINSTQVVRFFTKPCAMDILEKGIVECVHRREERRQTSESVMKPAFGDEVLDKLSIGVAICEQNARVVYMNQFAVEVCATQKTLSVDAAGFLRTVNPRYRDEFLACLKETEKQDRAISLMDDEIGRAVSIIVSRTKGGDANRVMLLIADPSRHVAPSVDILQSIYSLPPSEARILHFIVQGFSLQETAEKMQITESSARTYLKRVFFKTNTKSQPELIRSVLLTPALYMAS